MTFSHTLFSSSECVLAFFPVLVQWHAPFVVTCSSLCTGKLRKVGHYRIITKSYGNILKPVIEIRFDNKSDLIEGYTIKLSNKHSVIKR